MAVSVVTLAVFAGVFGLVYNNSIDRRVAMIAGALIILFLGTVFNFYSLHMAFDSIYIETLALIFGMSLISDTLSRSGFFTMIAARTAVYSRGNAWLLLVLFSLITYALSLFVNNLAAIVVILPITLNLCRTAKINPVPIIIAEIISSNLGGASTMVGDFPNMIISSAADLHFLDFIGGMMVPCLVLLAAMLLFFDRRRGKLIGDIIKKPGAARGSKKKIDKMFSGRKAPGIKDFYLFQTGMAVLVLVVIGFLASEYFDVRPGYIALAAGLILLVIGGLEKEEVFDACGAGDILFFTGLFVMVGGLNAAGVLNGMAWLIEKIGNGNGTFELLALMWIAGIVTVFLNAGPSTAFFIPVAAQMSFYIPGKTVWWALSLGVLAGSSAALTGATAGSIASSQLEKALEKYPEMAKYIPSGRGLDFKEFLRWGIPIMVIFLLLSSVYIVLVVE